MIDSCLTNYTSTTNGSDNDIEQELQKMIAKNSFDGERISEIKQGRKEKKQPGIKTEEGKARAEEQEGLVVAA
jgi:hypothetical protein